MGKFLASIKGREMAKFNHNRSRTRTEHNRILELSNTSTMISKSVKILMVAIAVVFMAEHTGALNFNRNQNGAGVVCIVQGTTTQNTTPRGCTTCVLSTGIENCIAVAAANAGLRLVCSSNTTNSTIPSNTCTFCTAAQLSNCNFAVTTSTTNVVVTDEIFACAIRTCSANVRVRYQGTVPVRVVDKVFVGLGNNNNNNALVNNQVLNNNLVGRKRRSEESASEESASVATAITEVKSFVGDYLLNDPFLMKTDDSKNLHVVADLDFSKIMHEIPKLIVHVDDEV